DGRYLAARESGTLLQRGMLSLWEVATGRLLWQSPGSESGYAQGMFSPDGEKFVSWGGDRTVSLWETTTGQLLCRHPLAGGDETHFPQVQANTQLFAALANHHVIGIWETATGKQKRLLPRQSR